MRTLLLVLIPTLLIASTTPGTVQRPSVEGRWAWDATLSPAALPVAPGALLGPHLEIAVADDHLVLTRSVGQTLLAVTYPLDGTRVGYPVPGQLCEGERVVHEGVRWEEDGLVLTTAGLTPAGGGPMVESASRRVLTREGNRLVVEGLVTQQGQSRRVGSVYVRTTEPMPQPPPPLPLTGTVSTIADVAWIGGQWEGTTSGVTTEEHWTTPASGGMIGVGRTLRGSALSGFEFLCIVERGGSLAYLAMPGARTPATVFMATAVTATAVTFENPAHDYPKLIRYTHRPDGGLDTTIAGANGAQSRTVTLARVAR